MNYSIDIGKYRFNSKTEYKLNIKEEINSGNYLKVKISLDFEENIVPNPVEISWMMPFKGIFSQWNPACWYNHIIRKEWDPVRVNSRLAKWMPLQVHMDVNGTNVSCVALSDVKTPLEISSGIIEENANMLFKLTLFTQRITPIKKYETELIIDNRSILYEEAVADIQNWWAELGYKNEVIPQTAMCPMYSTWYSYHQNLEHKEIVEELKRAKQLGMECVIIDDGWQTLDNNRGYAYCGDWEPKKLNDMKKLVEDIHTVGMKVMLWYSVPFVGKYSKMYNKMKKYFLDNGKKEWFILDPRFPVVREYLVSIYEKAVSEWKLDGLKLDFIDSFAITDDSKVYDEEMDIPSLEDAICVLLKEIKDRLSKINPDILIEFRQSYIGPIMRTYGNMLRVTDCPCDALQNRVQGAYLRMTSLNTAVHSDMLMWDYNDTPENAALQIINSIFCVLQISVLIEKLSEKHLKMLKFYLDFQQENKDCIFKGEFHTKNPEENFTQMYTCNEQSIIAVSYGRNILHTDKKYKKLVFINGTGDEELLIKNTAESYPAEVIVQDCMGNTILEEKRKINCGYNVFSVPPSGMVTLCL